MEKKNHKIGRFCFSLILLLGSPVFAHSLENASSTPNQDQYAVFYILPKQGTVIVGSTLEVFFYLNTYGEVINAIELEVKFSADKIRLVRPTGGISFVSKWTKPALFSNTEGVIKLSGEAMGGINTEAGLINTLTFQAIAPGTASIEILPSSKIFKKDSQSKNIAGGFGRSAYDIKQKPADGVFVNSASHPFEFSWYNDKNVHLSWLKEEENEEFSYEFDNKPLTIPDNNAESKDTLMTYEGVQDGLWFFHIKSRKNGVWGPTTHLSLRIDTTPPNDFVPKGEQLSASVIGRAMISFSTTDNLSGIDHYEVGFIDRSSNSTESPIFVRAESPYVLSQIFMKSARIVVRAIDKAGNVRDASTNITYSWPIQRFFLNKFIYIFFSIVVIMVYVIRRMFFGNKKYEEVH